MRRTKEESPLESWEEALLPAYLKAEIPSDEPSYGTLSYNKRRDCWTVKGEPFLTELCKRLFPGTAGARRGEAHVTNHPRMMRDLYWLMLRYPLTVKEADRKRWENAVLEAKRSAAKKAAFAQMPQRITPPAGAFLGELRPFQQEGLAFLLQHDRCLLADEMGLGKTVQALAALATDQLFPVLIVPPAHLVRNWQEEIQRFLRMEGRPPVVHVIKGLTPYDLPPADLYIMHYLLLRGWKAAIPTLDFRALVLDEVQELRHSGTEKYSAASLLAEKCQRVYGLSGTPIYNRGGEIWNVINILDYHFLGDWESFSREWCYGYGSALVIKPDVLGNYLK